MRVALRAGRRLARRLCTAARIGGTADRPIGLEIDIKHSAAALRDASEQLPSLLASHGAVGLRGVALGSPADLVAFARRVGDEIITVGDEGALVQLYVSKGGKRSRLPTAHLNKAATTAWAAADHTIVAAGGRSHRTRGTPTTHTTADRRAQPSSTPSTLVRRTHLRSSAMPSAHTRPSTLRCAIGCS